MAKAKIVGAVHTYIYTSKFIEVKEGKRAFISDITDRLLKK